MGRSASWPDDAEPDGIQRERVNLNALSRSSENLRLIRGLPSAHLKVRNQFLKRNERT